VAEEEEVVMSEDALERVGEQECPAATV